MHLGGRFACAELAAKAAANANRSAAATCRALGLVVASSTLTTAACAADAALADILRRATTRSTREMVNEEVKAWQLLGAPALSERVLAGREARAPDLPGPIRAGRNVAEHKSLGMGLATVQAMAAHPQRAQRGGRRRRKAATETSTGEGDGTATESAVDEVITGAKADQEAEAETVLFARAKAKEEAEAQAAVEAEAKAKAEEQSAAAAVKAELEREAHSMAMAQARAALESIGCELHMEDFKGYSIQQLHNFARNLNTSVERHCKGGGGDSNVGVSRSG